MAQTSSIDFRSGFLRISGEKKAALKNFGPVVEMHIDDILDEFYEHITGYAELAGLLSSPQVAEHARKQQRKYWLENIFAGNFGPSYLEAAMVIARTHERIGLRPEYYLGGYELALERLLALVSETYGPSFAEMATGRGAAKLAKVRLTQGAVMAAVFLDIGLVIDVYFAEVQKTSAVILEQLASQLEEDVGGVVSSLSHSADEMKSVAGSLAAAAEQGSQQANAVASAAEEAAANVQTVAAASEELSSSISEISRQVHNSTEVTKNAVTQAESTNSAVHGLSDKVVQIGEIVELINRIAEQTNLLALNATIESARAGEAGKGFAVVAGEVKSLAKQTAEATEELASQIEEVPRETSRSVDAIKEVNATIAAIQNIATAIASAVEEQGAATQEISRNVHEAAIGTNEVTRNIEGVYEAARQTGGAAEQVSGSANDFSDQARELNDRVSGFLAAMQEQTEKVKAAAGG